MAMSFVGMFSSIKFPSVHKNHEKQPLSIFCSLKLKLPQKPNFCCNCASNNEFSAAFNNLTGLNKFEDVLSIFRKLTDQPEFRKHMDKVILGDAPQSRLLAFTVALVDENGTIRDKLDTHIDEYTIDDKPLLEGCVALLLENADSWISTRSLVSRSFTKFFDKIYEVLHSLDFIVEMNPQHNINGLELMVQMVVDKPISHKGIKSKEDFKNFLRKLSTAGIRHVGAKCESPPLSTEWLKTSKSYSHLSIDGR